MGMYTQLKLDVNLKPDPELLKVLTFMDAGDTEQVNSFLTEIDSSAPLFATERWSWMLKGDSAYFDDYAPPTISVNKENIHFTCCFNIKNYGDEIKKFLDYLSPYILDVGKIGEYMYEEWDFPENVNYNINTGIRMGE